MAELSTLARPYAKAAFDYANEQSVVNQWEDFLFIASTVVNDASFKDILDNPVITAEQKTSTIADIFDSQVAVDGDTPFKALLLSSQIHQDKGSDEDVLFKADKVTPAIRNFVQQLADQDRLTLLPQVYEQFRLLRAKTLKQVDAYVTSAYPLDSTQRALIQSRLEKSLNASINLHESVNPDLLGGATIKIGDKLVDDSIRGKLKVLKSQLTA